MAHFFGIFCDLSFERNLFFEWSFLLNHLKGKIRAEKLENMHCTKRKKSRLHKILYRQRLRKTEIRPCLTKVLKSDLLIT